MNYINKLGPKTQHSPLILILLTANTKSLFHSIAQNFLILRLSLREFLNKVTSQQGKPSFFNCMYLILYVFSFLLLKFLNFLEVFQIPFCGSSQDATQLTNSFFSPIRLIPHYCMLKSNVRIELYSQPSTARLKKSASNLAFRFHQG